MNCCTGGTPGSRERGSVHEPSVNSAPSPQGGTFRQASTKETGHRIASSRRTPSERSAIEWSVFMLVEVVASNALLVPVRDARSQPMAGEEVEPLPLPAARVHEVVDREDDVRLRGERRREPLVDLRAVIRAESTSWMFSGGTLPPVGSTSHSRTERVADGSTQVGSFRPVLVDTDYTPFAMRYSPTTVTRSVTGSIPRERGDPVQALRQRAERRRVPAVAGGLELPTPFPHPSRHVLGDTMTAHRDRRVDARTSSGWSGVSQSSTSSDCPILPSRRGSRSG